MSERPFGARPVHLNHHDDLVDSDQEVVNKELSLSERPFGGGGTSSGTCVLITLGLLVDMGLFNQPYAMNAKP